jgi:hypothetical protein
MNQTIGQFTLSIVVALTTILGAIATAQANPIIRAKPNTEQVPGCYIEMPNALPRDLNELCMVGKVLGPRIVDMVTDNDGDGVPDELALELQKFERASRAAYQNGSPEGAQMQRVSQALLDMNERMPYSDATKTVIRELAALTSVPRSTASEPTIRRVDQLVNQMRQDPIFQKVDEYRQKLRRDR